MKFYNLTFVKKTEQKSGHNFKWELLCDCGNTHYACPGPVIGGSTKSCGCIQVETRIRNGLNVRRYEPSISSARKVWQITYSKEGIDFNTFLQLSQQPCHYCGRPPHRTTVRYEKKSSTIQIEDGEFTYNGLDRVDSNLGHTIDNVVPCCFDCNYSKRDKTMSEFLDHIERMYEGTRRLR